VVVSLVGLGAVGCGAVGYPTGSVYTGTTVPHGAMLVDGAGAGKGGKKHGEACATGILGIVAFGDASLGAAKKAGGVTDVQSVEYSGLNILGVYTKGCTVAYGGGGEAPPGVTATGLGGGGAEASGAGESGELGQPTTDPATGTRPAGHGPTGTPGTGPVHHVGPADPGASVVAFNVDMQNWGGVHMCLSYNPADVPSGQSPFAMSKEQYARPQVQGTFVDRCPTEGLVATCDHRTNKFSGPNDDTESYYGVTDPLSTVLQGRCLQAHGAWSWAVPRKSP
jgi:hypothetical protein